MGRVFLLSDASRRKGLDDETESPVGLVCVKVHPSSEAHQPEQRIGLRRQTNTQTNTSLTEGKGGGDLVLG